MKSCSITFLVALAASAFAIPTSTSHAVHEKRSAHSWTKVNNAKPDGNLVLPVRIGLTQSNLHDGHDLLMSVSDPRSDNYGKHWTASQVTFLI